MKTKHTICAAYSWQVIADWAAMVCAYFAACFAPSLEIAGQGSGALAGVNENIPHLTYAYEWQGKACGSRLILTTPAYAPHIGQCCGNRGVSVSEQMRCPRWTWTNRWRRVQARFQNFERGIYASLTAGIKPRLARDADPPTLRPMSLKSYTLRFGAEPELLGKGCHTLPVNNFHCSALYF